MNQTNLISVAKLVTQDFIGKQSAIEVTPILRGHLNCTFKVEEKSNLERTFLLQKINEKVFSPITGLMENTESVLTALASTMDSADFISLSSPQLIRSLTGALFVRDNEGNPWRMSAFVANSHSFDVPPNPNIAFEAGKGAGLFLRACNRGNPLKLVDLLPGFQDTEQRQRIFQQALLQGNKERIAQAYEPIEFLNRHCEKGAFLGRLLKNPTIPLRITHGDMKLNNILFKKDDDTFICFVDLDTVMYGTILYDFGDLTRTATVAGLEDDENSITFSLSYFEKMVEGFASTYSNHLNKSEKQALSSAPVSFVLTTATRFLTDYLLNDAYFSIKYPEHNLVRARAQINLAKQLLNYEEDLAKICGEYLR